MRKKIKTMGFRRRFTRRMFNWLLFFIFLSIYVFFSTYILFFILFSVSIICLNIIISFKESINYIEVIEIESDIVKVCYSYKDSHLSTFEYRVSEINIEYIGNGIGFTSISSPRIIFKKGDQIVLKQFSVGFWNSNLMIEIEKEFRKYKPYSGSSI